MNCPARATTYWGNQPEKWRTNVPNYAKLTRSSVYPGIDVVYYGTQRELEYDFVVGAHANPAEVRINFAGHENLHTDAAGDLVLGLAGGYIRLHKPVAYQEIGGKSRSLRRITWFAAGTRRALKWAITIRRRR